MCGIFGYVGTRTASPILLEGLRTLEYRGYDSAGICITGEQLVKAVGPIDELVKKIPETIPGTAGIAHSRWATHGAPTEANAHPHLDALESQLDRRERWVYPLLHPIDAFRRFFRFGIDMLRTQ